MILLYEIDKLPGWPALQTAMAMKQETYRLVQPDEYHLTLGQLTAGEKTGPSVHEIFQAKIFEWITILSSRGSSRPRIELTSLN